MTREQQAFRKAHVDYHVAKDALMCAFREAHPVGATVSFLFAGQLREGRVEEHDPERPRAKVRAASAAGTAGGKGYWIEGRHIADALDALAAQPEIAQDRA